MDARSRRWVYAALGAVAVVVLIGMGLKIYFTPERLRAMILPRISEAMNQRTVDVRDVRLGFWGGLHASVSGLVVGEREGFGDRPFVQVEEAALRLAFWPLLRGEVSIVKVALEGPRISIVVSAEGEANYADLVEESEEPSDAPVRLPALAIVDGALFYADRRNGFALEIEGLGYGLTVGEQDGEMLLVGDLSAQRLSWGTGDLAEGLNAGALRVAHRLRMGANGQTWGVDALEVAWGGLGAMVSGQVQALDDGFDLDLHIKEPRLDLNAVSDLVGDVGMRVSGRAGFQAKVAGLLKTSEPPVYPEIDARMVLAQMAVQGDALPGPVGVDTAALAFADGRLALEMLSGRLLGGAVRMSGQATGLWPPGDRVRAWLEVQADSLVAPEVQADDAAPVQGLPAWLGDFDAEVGLRIGALVAGDFAVRDLAGRVRLQDGRIYAEDVRLRAFGGAVRASGELDARRAEGPFPVRAALEAEGLRLKAMLGDALGVGYDADGALSASVRANGRLDGALQPVLLPDAYRLEGQVRLSEGTARTPDLKAPVDTLEATLVLQPGDVLQIERLFVRAGKTDLLARGRVAGAVDHLARPEAGTRPRAALSAQSRMVDLDDLYVDPAQLPKDSDQTSGALIFARTADGVIRAQIDALMSDGIRYGDLRAVVRAKAGVLQVDSIRASVLGGALAAQAEIDARPNTGLAPMRAVALLTRIEAAQLLQNYMKWPIPMLGQMGTSVAIEGMMDSTLTLVDHTLTANGEARLDEGRVVNWPWLQTTSGFVPQMQFLNFSDLPLKALVAPFRIDGGRVFLNDVSFLSGDSAFRIAGSAGLDGSLDVTLNADLPVSRLNVAGLGLNLKSDTRVPLRVHVSGMAAAPKVDVRLDEAAQKAIEEKARELQDKARDRAKELFRSLF